MQQDQVLLQQELRHPARGEQAAEPAELAADRDAINREMPLIAEYEGKRNEVKKAVNVLATNGLFDSHSGKEVKESLDIEYVYYEA